MAVAGDRPQGAEGDFLCRENGSRGSARGARDRRRGDHKDSRSHVPQRCVDLAVAIGAEQMCTGFVDVRKRNRAGATTNSQLQVEIHNMFFIPRNVAMRAAPARKHSDWTGGDGKISREGR
jgi:hypothetical protein